MIEHPKQETDTMNAQLANIMDNHGHATAYITSHIAVWDSYAIEVGDNGLTGDARRSIKLAPEVGGWDQYIYVTTNGGPSMIGWLDDGDLEVADDARESLADDSMAWAREILSAQFSLTL
jgi:hypothetical protein